MSPADATEGRSTAALLWGLSRPRGALYVVLLPLLGFSWGHWDRALTLRNGVGLLSLMAAWALLNAGTMWLNAALDRDEGGVLFGRSLPVPDAAVPAGVIALIAAVGLAATAGPVPGSCALGCAVLAVLYSHPRTAWKGHPVGGPVVNAVGYGILSPMAGWWLVEVTANPRTVVTWGLFVPWVLGCYLVAQVFQRDEDALRGYRTLVVTHGAETTLRLGRLLLGTGAMGLGVLCLVGWYPRLGLVALLLYLVADRRMVAVPTTDGGAWADALFRRLLRFAWVFLALIFVHYFADSYQRLPVAGLGTVRGHPTDRPLLSPMPMRRWEAEHGD